MSTSTITGKTVIDEVVSIDKGGGTLRTVPVYDEKGNLLVVTEDKWSTIIELKESTFNNESGRYYMTIDGYGLFKLMNDRSYLYRVITLPISDPEYKIIHFGMSDGDHAFWLVTYDKNYHHRLWFYDREYKQLTQTGNTSISNLLSKTDSSLQLQTVRGSNGALASIEFYNIQYNNMQRHIAVIPDSIATQYVYIIIGNLTYLQMQLTFSSTHSENTIPLTSIECKLKHIDEIADGEMIIGEYTSTSPPPATEMINGEYIISVPYGSNGGITTSKRIWYQSANITLYNNTAALTSYTLWLYTNSEQQPQNITESYIFKEFHKNQHTRKYGRVTTWTVNGGNILIGSSFNQDGYTTINLMDTGIKGDNAFICLIMNETPDEGSYNMPTFSADMTIDDVNDELKNKTSYIMSFAVITDSGLYRVTFNHPIYYRHGNTSYTKLRPNISVNSVLEFSSDIGTIKAGFNNTSLNENTLGVITDKGIITIDLTSPAEYIFQPLYYVNNYFVNSYVYWNYWGVIRIPTGFISTINGAVPIVMNVQGEINSLNINAYSNYFHKCMILIEDIQKRLTSLENKQ